MTIAITTQRDGDGGWRRLHGGEKGPEKTSAFCLLLSASPRFMQRINGPPTAAISAFEPEWAGARLGSGLRAGTRGSRSAPARHPDPNPALHLDRFVGRLHGSNARIETANRRAVRGTLLPPCRRSQPTWPVATGTRVSPPRPVYAAPERRFAAPSLAAGVGCVLVRLRRWRGAWRGWRGRARGGAGGVGARRWGGGRLRGRG